jgi:hypothetical protein
MFTKSYWNAKNTFLPSGQSQEKRMMFQNLFHEFQELCEIDFDQSRRLLHLTIIKALAKA